jgi:hypothetical protein
MKSTGALLLASLSLAGSQSFGQLTNVPRPFSAIYAFGAHWLVPACAVNE